MPTLRTLQPGDEVSLEAFLLQHTDTFQIMELNNSIPLFLMQKRAFIRRDSIFRSKESSKGRTQ